MMFNLIRNFIHLATQRVNLVVFLATENLALRQQLIVLMRNQSRPKLREWDRLFWVLLLRIWSG